jgi:hypothetical protein
VRARKEIKDEAHQLQDEEQEEWDRMEGGVRERYMSSNSLLRVLSRMRIY